MPLKTNNANDQYTSFPVAEAICKKLELKGFTGLDLREMVTVNGVVNPVSVHDSDWYDDGGKHQFLIKLWGSDMDVGLLLTQLKTGTFNEWIQVASVSYYNANPAICLGQALSSVLNIKGVMEVLEKSLKL